MSTRPHVYTASIADARNEPQVTARDHAAAGGGEPGIARCDLRSGLGSCLRYRQLLSACFHRAHGCPPPKDANACRLDDRHRTVSSRLPGP